MPGTAVSTKDYAGGMQLGGHCPWYTVDGDIQVCLFDPVVPHAPYVPKHIPSPYMAEGVDWFIIDGLPACREMNLADCGHPTTGRSWFQING